MDHLHRFIKNSLYDNLIQHQTRINLYRFPCARMFIVVFECQRLVHKYTHTFGKYFLEVDMVIEYTFELWQFDHCRENGSGKHNEKNKNHSFDFEKLQNLEPFNLYSPFFFASIYQTSLMPVLLSIFVNVNVIGLSKSQQSMCVGSLVIECCAIKISVTLSKRRKSATSLFLSSWKETGIKRNHHHRCDGSMNRNEQRKIQETMEVTAAYTALF